MKTFQTDFQTRCTDVENYLRVLVFMDNLASNKHVELKGESYEGPEITHVVDRDEQKILRASFYLLMYNVVESTTNSIIASIMDAINDEGVCLMQLSKPYRKLYMDGVFNGISNTNSIQQMRFELVNGIESNKNIILEHLKFNTSGSVDYDFVLKVIGRLRCRGRITIDESKLRAAMKRTKDHRNHLAHGNISFSDCGSSVVLNTIMEDYHLIHDFFEEVLASLSNFIDSKKYLKGR